MDKKDFEENEKQQPTDHNEEQPAAETVNESANELPTTGDQPEGPEQEQEPVMREAGAAAAQEPASSNTGRGGKGWMIASIVLAAALIIVLIKPPFQTASGKEAVATVNGTDITKDELYNKLVEAGGKSTLDAMITQKLVEQEAEKANVTVTDEDISKEIKDLENQFGGEEALNNALSQSGMTMEDLKKQMPLQVQLRKILEPQVKITDEEIKADFDANKDTYNTEEEVRASHILVATKEEADSILSELKAGGDFAEIAQKKSTDPGSKEKGGDLGFFKRGDMVPEFSTAAFALEVGQTSGAVKSDYGYHIIKVTDHKDAVNATLESKKEDIREKLTSQKISELSSTWMEETKNKAKISNTLTDEPENEPAASEEAPAATESAQ